MLEATHVLVQREFALLKLATREFELASRKQHVAAHWDDLPPRGMITSYTFTRRNNVRVVKADSVVSSPGKKRPEEDLSPAVSSAHTHSHTHDETPHPRIAVCACAVRAALSERPLTRKCRQLSPGRIHLRACQRETMSLFSRIFLGWSLSPQQRCDFKRRPTGGQK